MTLPDRTPTQSDGDTLGFVMELFSEARRDKRQYLERWNRYYRAFRNKTYSEFRPAWAPSPSASEIFPSYHTLVSWMTDQTPDIRVSARPEVKDGISSPPEAVIEKAQDMQSLVSSWWVNHGVTKELQMSLFDLLTFGTGVLKTGWDQGYQNGLGDAFLRRADPYNILPDPHAAGIDDSRYFFEVSRVPIFEILSRFPDRGHLVKPDAGKGEDVRPSVKSGFEVIPMGNPAATGVTGAFPGTASANMPARFGYPGSQGYEDYTRTVLLIECWVRTTESYTVPLITAGEYKGNIDYERPVWQYVCIANGVVLTPDVSNPFNHGQLPYLRIPYVETGEWWSVPLTEHVGPAQVALNRLLAAIQTSAELVGNPIWMETEDAGISRTKIINRPGSRIVRNAGSDAGWVNPPAVSSNVADMASFWIDEIDKITGVAAVRGQNLRRREPTGAVEAVQEAAFVRVRAVLRNVEEGLRLAANQTVSNIAQFYLEPRTVAMVGPKGSNNDYLILDPKHFYLPMSSEEGLENVPVNFDAWIEAGSTQPLSRAARAAEIDSLYFMGVVDDEAVADAHDLPDRQNVLQRAQEKKVSGQMPQATNPRKR